ncbi:MAG: hypothetical protein HY718_19415, partial [Planctomycetes bacterium]|nr:hypothetical protein [Planctomycetota bacterium]
TILGTTAATRTHAWERIIASGPPKEDTTDIELVLRVEGENAVASFDEVQLIHWPTFSGIAPLVATRFEQQLFIVDTLRTLLAWPTPRTHLHHLFGNYPCTTLDIEGADRDNAVPFTFLNGRIGDRVVKTECDVPTFDYNTTADKYASDFNALAPDATGVPALSVLTTRDERTLYVLLVNRTSDRPIEAEIRFLGAPLAARGDVRTLAGADFDVPGATIRTASLAVTDPLTHVVPPHAAQVLTVGFAGREAQ